MCGEPHLNVIISFSLDVIRVEKKERARLKTVKFHARTGMIESNRVSAVQGGEGWHAGMVNEVT